MFQGSGTIQYDPPRKTMKRRTRWWCVLNVHGGNELVRYFRWWIDREIINPFNQSDIGLKRQSWFPHISCIRGEEPFNDKKHLWKKYQGEKVEFFYDHVSNFIVGENKKGSADGYFFLVEVDCPRLIEIRREFGFKRDWKLHLTFGRIYS